MKIYYLPVSSTELSYQSLKQSMRRWHWRQYFLALRAQDTDRAQYHRTLAESLEPKKRLGK